VYLYNAIIAGAPRLAVCDHPAMPDFVSYLLVAPLLWHKTKDEGVAPAWAAVPLAKSHPFGKDARDLGPEKRVNGPGYSVCPSNGRYLAN
jgi:hypothetical protein